MLKLVSWNLAHRPELWRVIAETEADVALLQEACAPPPDIMRLVGVDSEPWRTEGAGLQRAWRAAVVQLNPNVQVNKYLVRSVSEAHPGELAVSRVGTLAAADVRDPGSGEVFASTDLADRVRVHALNLSDEWGPSDHCRILITVE